MLYNLKYTEYSYVLFRKVPTYNLKQSQNYLLLHNNSFLLFFPGFKWSKVRDDKADEMDCTEILLSLNMLLPDEYYHANAATMSRDAWGIRKKRDRIFSVI